MSDKKIIDWIVAAIANHAALNGNTIVIHSSQTPNQISLLNKTTGDQICDVDVGLRWPK